MPICMYILIFALSDVNVTLTSMLLSIDSFQNRVSTDQYDMLCCRLKYTVY